jgi:lysyl-tRNA synthetase class 2
MLSFREKLELRARFHQEVRRFFEGRDFLEVQTPLLVENPGLEPELHYFEASWWDYRAASGKRDLRRRFYLPTSPEYHLKKALAESGLPRIFEITRAFRNSELSDEHQPEFTMLEWYRAPGDYTQIARDCEDLIQALAPHFARSAAWLEKAEHLSVAELFERELAIDLDKELAHDGGEGFAGRHHSRFADLAKEDAFEDAFFKLFLTHLESKLGRGRPTFVWDYPIHFQALSAPKPDKAYYCQRFELYFNGIELGNCFTELLEESAVRAKCERDIAKRQARYGEAPPLDEELVKASARLAERGPAGGIAVGLDRLLQAMQGLPSLQDLLAFPR